MELDLHFVLILFGGCEGQYVIDSSEIGLSVFLTEEEADAHWGNGHGLPTYC